MEQYPEPPFEPNKISTSQWDDFKGDIYSFNFRMSFPNIDRAVLERQWDFIFKLLAPVLDYVEDLVYQEHVLSPGAPCGLSIGSDEISQGIFGSPPPTDSNKTRGSAR